MNSWIVSSPSRLLSFLREKLSSDHKTKDIRWAVEHNHCSVNGGVERFCSRPLKKGDKVSVAVSERPLFGIEKDRILYEDEWLIAYNKPPYISSPDLASLLSALLVHRLDRDTTGVLILAKNTRGQKALEELFRARSMHKEYIAIVAPPPKEKEGIITLPMRLKKRREGAVIWEIGNGLSAKTTWKLEKKGKNFALLRCIPHTGRTHQIRVHLKAIGHPILGDYEYGSKNQQGSFRPLLHAEKLRFQHPFTNITIEISSSPPSDFQLL